jgi:hypothetical protein
MAKKVAAKFVATIELNPEKAGGWLAIVSVQKEASGGINSMQPAEGLSEYAAWKNASAAKRWVKSMVLKHTPRKSVKMVVTKEDKTTGKPTLLSGVLEYKVDA